MSILLGAAPLAAAQEVAASYVKSATKLTSSAKYKAAVATLDADHDRTVEDIIKITQIPAPPFKEEARARAYMEMFKAHGLSDVEMDPEGNVLGLRKGSDDSLVVIAAHLDTVFPEGTPVKVRREGTRLFAPGVADDSRSLAVLLAYMRALDAAKIRTKHSILFVGTVGEEGQGDLRGVRYFFTKGKYKDRVRYFFSMDGTEPRRVTHGGVGSRRYRVTFKGPGGHSFGAFGIVNPMTAMSQAVVEFYKTQVPAQPKTTFAASVTGGGTSVNSIPNEVFMEFDMRSEAPAELAKVEQQLLAAIDAGVAQENAARSTKSGSVSAEKTLIGDRPAGSTPLTATLVQSTAAAVKAMGYEPDFNASSTDSNIPMSLGIQAVTISGGHGARSHSLDEYIDVEKTESVRAMQVGLISLLAVAEMK
jgi:acetylornithine deacetylase/succinyl-diaminopimelate desuccinylase-like protein